MNHTIKQGMAGQARHDKMFVILALLLCAVFSLSAKTYNMQELGADIAGKKKCSVLINKTIEKAAAEGGGTLYFPAGEYLTGPIYMKSNITLNIESGALIRFSDDFEDYLPFINVRWEGVFMNAFAPLINAQNAENITITGRGTIDGQGEKWWKATLNNISQIRSKGDLEQFSDLQRRWDDANPNIEVSDYYKNTLKRRFFRPPFIQFLECKNIRIDGIKIQNSPFWTINPVGCDNVLVHGVTIKNPEAGPNTDGINPSSCSNVRISNCFISVGDDCVTIKSGRDADGRKYGKPCENITITNCVMLSGHGGVVIGSEMSGGVKKVTISNCVFDGTDAGIRLKASRGRGGVVEEIRVDNIVMNNIQKNAFIFDLFYDRNSQLEPVSERTPVFRNIHLSNITGNNVKKVGYITGIEEMPIEEISFSNVNIVAETGFTAKTAKNIQFHNVDFAVEKGASIAIVDCRDIVLDNVRTKAPLANQAIVELTDVNNAFITNCFQLTSADVFCKTKNSRVVWGTNFLNNVKQDNIQE
ncbi:MAG: glycoside hydrolase family 28 protein [Dysgonamonadaceae bacterium]|jgi:polygalacturonase|nr:glycoside hydrolase family 28 protein [Dysgonamonadaceae bacterium]